LFRQQAIRPELGGRLVIDGRPVHARADRRLRHRGGLSTPGFSAPALGIVSGVHVVHVVLAAQQRGDGGDQAAGDREVERDLQAVRERGGDQGRENECPVR